MAYGIPAIHGQASFEHKERGMACPFLIGKLHKNGEAKLCNVAKRKKDEFFEKLCPEMSRSGNLYYRGENDPCTRRHSYEIVICGCRIGQSHPEILPE